MMSSSSFILKSVLARLQYTGGKEMLFYLFKNESVSFKHRVLFSAICWRNSCQKRYSSFWLEKITGLAWGSSSKYLDLLVIEGMLSPTLCPKEPTGSIRLKGRYSPENWQKGILGVKVPSKKKMKDCTITERIIFAIIRRQNRKNRKCAAKYIQKLTGLADIRTVNRALASLKKKEYIKKDAKLSHWAVDFRKALPIKLELITKMCNGTEDNIVLSIASKDEYYEDIARLFSLTGHKGTHLLNSLMGKQGYGKIIKKLRAEAKQEKQHLKIEM